jgi:hypothetical protein
MISSAVSMRANADSIQTPEKGAKQERLTEQEVAEKVNSWTIKAKEHKACLEKSNEDGYAIALEVVAVDRQPREVKSAYLETLFGKIKAPVVSTYRRVGKCTLLHQESTKAVIGCLPINVAVQFARMKPTLQSKILDYFRARGLKPSRESLKEARREAGEMKPVKPSASKQQTISEEPPRPPWRKELATIEPLGNEPFNEWEASRQEKAVAWLQRTQRDAPTVGLKLELAEALNPTDGIEHGRA